MKIIALLATHVLALVIGGYAVNQHYVDDVLPETRYHLFVDPRYIRFTESQNRVEYYRVVSQMFLGNMYLRNPAYTSRREKGERILADLAYQGYTPAAQTLYGYYIADSYDFALFHEEGYFEVQDMEKYRQAYHWARLALEQGSAIPMSFFIKFYRLEDFKDITQEIEMIKPIARRSTIPTYAELVSDYYARNDKPEQAEYWTDVAEEIANSPRYRQGQAHHTITPWRGL